jgi:hypothetical protein
MSALPSAVYTLLELLGSAPHLRHDDIPQDLHNALRIALTENLVATQTAGIWGEALKHDAYRSLLGRAYWLTAAGRDALAWHAESERADRKAEAGKREKETGTPLDQTAGQGSTLAMTATDPAHQQGTPPAQVNETEEADQNAKDSTRSPVTLPDTLVDSVSGATQRKA